MLNLLRSRKIPYSTTETSTISTHIPIAPGDLQAGIELASRLAADISVIGMHSFSFCVSYNARPAKREEDVSPHTHARDLALHIDVPPE